MLAYRNPSNEDSDSIFNYTLKLDAYDLPPFEAKFESKLPLFKRKSYRL